MNWQVLRSYAYAPYSEKASCCLIRGKSGILYPGVRIENISYPLTITAEQAAVTSCLSESDIPVELIYPQPPGNHSQFWMTEFDLKVFVNEDFPKGNHFDPVKKTTVNRKYHLDQLKNQAVTPNSSFPVSVLLFCDKGMIEGVNVEFSDWPHGLCAERVAIAKALSAGVQTFKKLSIYVCKSEFASPCGGCRQVISEWMNHQIIELFHGNGTFSSYPAKEFLPYGFRTSSLRKKI